MITTRAETGLADPTRTPIPIETPTPRLWLHHSAGRGTGPTAVRAIQRYHQRTRGWSDLAYSWLVGDQVYEGRGPGVDHLTSDGRGSHSICLMGDYTRGPVPTPMIERAGWLVAHGILAGWWATGLTGGHRDIPGGTPSTCPGNYGMAAIPEINRIAADTIHDMEDDTMASDQAVGHDNRGNWYHLWGRWATPIHAEAAELLQYLGVPKVPTDLVDKAIASDTGWMEIAHR